MKNILEKIQHLIRRRNENNIEPGVIILNSKQQKELANILSGMVGVNQETRTNRILGLHIINNEEEIIKSEELI